MTGRQKDREKRQIDRMTGRQNDRKTERQIDRKTEGQKDREKERPKDRKSERQKDQNKFLIIYFCFVSAFKCSGSHFM